MGTESKKSAAIILVTNLISGSNPPASEASRYVANLTERKKIHIWCQRICLSVCLSVVNFVPNYLRTGNNYPYSPHWQGGTKFATQISPLLNLYETVIFKVVV